MGGLDMIYFYSGTPGSGKSLHVAREIEKKIQSGGNVIANFEFNDSLIRKKFRKKKGQFVYVDNGKLMFPIEAREIVNQQSGLTKKIETSPLDVLYRFALNFHKKNKRGQILEHQTLFIIDEAQILFNSREWQNRDRKEWVIFFTQHRKYGYDIIIISQFERLLDRQIRGCFEYEVNHKKVMNYKTLGVILSIFARGSLFVAVTHWYGVKGKENNVGAKFYTGKRKYYNMYNSYKIFDSEKE